jgi:hypothetical protein
MSTMAFEVGPMVGIVFVNATCQKGLTNGCCKLKFSNTFQSSHSRKSNTRTGLKEMFFPNYFSRSTNQKRITCVGGDENLRQNMEVKVIIEPKEKKPFFLSKHYYE